MMATRFDQVLDELSALYPEARETTLLDLAFAEAIDPEPFVYRLLGAGCRRPRGDADRGPVGIHPCRFPSPGLFAFDGDGPDAFVVVARDRDGETPVDLVAWLPGKPKMFGAYLGRAEVLRSRWGAEDETKHPHPLAWLKAGCRGYVEMPVASLSAMIEREAA